MFFVEAEGTASSLRGLAEVIDTQGLPSSLYTDRGSPKPAFALTRATYGHRG